MPPGSHRRRHSHRRRRGHRKIVRFGAALLLFVVALIALGIALTRIRERGETETTAGVPETAVTPANPVELTAANSTANRVVFPYSVIPGGVDSVEALKTAITKDPVVAAHYRDFDLSRARVERLETPRVAHVSYRIGDNVYWTRKPLVLPAGERVITDGTHIARTRCGNQLADTPAVTSTAEPSAAALDTPVSKPGGLTSPSPQMMLASAHPATSPAGTAAPVPSGSGSSSPMGGSGGFGSGFGGAGVTPAGAGGSVSTANGATTAGSGKPDGSPVAGDNEPPVDTHTTPVSNPPGDDTHTSSGGNPPGGPTAGNPGLPAGFVPPGLPGGPPIFPPAGGNPFVPPGTPENPFLPPGTPGNPNTPTGFTPPDLPGNPDNPGGPNTPDGDPPNDPQHPDVPTPVPEPSSVMLMLMGLGGAVARLRKR